MAALAPFASIGQDLFQIQIPVVEKVLRSLLVFVFLVVALRVGGKRELGQLNVLDFVVLLLVSNALQNAMIGADNSLVGGLLGASVLFAVNYVFVRVTFNNRTARRLLEGQPRVLLRGGELDEAALRREAISPTELLSAALDKGFTSLRDVGLIVLETNGHLAILDPEHAGRWEREQDRQMRM
jgi:uncharacterized membrane protein YcaP (DUF421 family)